MNNYNDAETNIVEEKEQQISIREITSELEEIKKTLKEMKSLLKYSIDKQYYFNAFFDPELLKLQSISDQGILLCGNYGNPNTGDEWMLDTILDYLHKYTTKNITIMLEPNRIFDPSIYLKYNVNYIHYPRTIYDYDVIVNKFDILIFGGGAIIEDGIYYEAYDYGVNICRTVVDLPLRFIAKNKKVFCIGLSTSTTLTNNEYIRKLQSVISQATYFSVRDRYSFNVLEVAGICTDKVHLIHDIVYANHYLEKAIDIDKKSINPETIHIGIVYIVSKENEEAFFHLLKKIKKEVKSQGKKYEITIIPFYDCWHVDYDFYMDAVKEEDSIEVISYNSDIQFMIEVFLQQDIMVCARYHAILLSLCLGIPCVGLYYDTHQHYYNKTSYLLEQFGFHLDDCISLSMLKSMDDPILDNILCVDHEDGARLIIKEAKNELQTLFENNL